MVNFIQPSDGPLPTGIELTVILAVHNVAKGAAYAISLRQDYRIQAHKPEATIKVMALDVDDYDSVQRFTKQPRKEIPVGHLLILNAGIGLLQLERSPSGHDRTTQTGAKKTGKSARISWVGSRAHENPSFDKKTPIKTGEGVLTHMDKEENSVPLQRYGDSKLFCVLVLCSLVPRLDPKKVIINMMCPGMVNNNMSDALPLHLCWIVNVVKAIPARPVETGSWIILNSALVVDPESHGKFLVDKTMADKAAFIKSPAGQEIQRKLREETIAEMSKLTTLPAELR